MTTTISGTSGVTFPDSGIFTNAVGSIGANGYQKLPNGLIMQWGSSSTSLAGQGTGTVSFPIAFTSAVYSVLLTGRGLNSATGDQGSIDSYSESTTGFSYKNNGDSAYTGGFYWFAIGT